MASVPAVSNAIRARRPDLHALLCRDYHRTRQGEELGGERATYAMPIFAARDGRFTTQYSRTFVEAAQKIDGIPRLTPEQDEALDLLAEVADELGHEMELRPGDMQLLNNHVVYHGRTAYTDEDGAERDRLLLRLWLAPADSRPLPDGFEVLWGSIEPGAVRGGIAQPDTLLTPAPLRGQGEGHRHAPIGHPHPGPSQGRGSFDSNPKTRRSAHVKVVDAIARILKIEGAEFLSAYPTTPLIEAVAKVDIRPVLCRQERVGVGIADGYARASNGQKLAAFCMQYGPGAENAFPGVATAFSDSTPMLLLPLGHQRDRAQVFPMFSSARTYASVTKSVETISRGRAGDRRHAPGDQHDADGAARAGHGGDPRRRRHRGRARRRGRRLPRR